MKEVKDFLLTIGIDIAVMIAGLVGALVMISKKSAFNIKTTVIGVITGMLSANYLTELVTNLLNLQTSTKYGIAFILGYLGLKGVENVMNRLHKTVNTND